MPSHWRRYCLHTDKFRNKWAEALKSSIVMCYRLVFSMRKITDGTWQLPIDDHSGINRYVSNIIPNAMSHGLWHLAAMTFGGCVVVVLECCESPTSCDRGTTTENKSIWLLGKWRTRKTVPEIRLIFTTQIPGRKNRFSSIPIIVQPKSIFFCMWPKRVVAWMIRQLTVSYVYVPYMRSRLSLVTVFTPYFWNSACEK